MTPLLLLLSRSHIPLLLKFEKIYLQMLSLEACYYPPPIFASSVLLELGFFFFFVSTFVRAPNFGYSLWHSNDKNHSSSPALIIGQAVSEDNFLTSVFSPLLLITSVRRSSFFLSFLKFQPFLFY